MSDINTWYKFVLQQLAAESYLDRISTGEGLTYKDILMFGNTDTRKTAEFGYTRMTEVQATEFLQEYEIVDHNSNDLQSGFSATLMRNKDTGEYTLSFRSTEYRQVADGGDFVRDAQGADVDFTQYGFAFAQIQDMEQYYADLKASGKLPAGATLNVTGYSLGGHLATVFTELHAVEISHTYLFNSPGRGYFDSNAYSIADIQTDFWAAVSDPATHQLNGVDMQQAFPGASGYTYQDIYTRAVNAAGQSLPTENIYADPRYQWALIWSKDSFVQRVVANDVEWRVTA